MIAAEKRRRGSCGQTIHPLDTATLQYPGGELDLEIVHATEGSDGIALGPLLAKTGYTTFDGGFVNTSATKSAITYIDGDAGILRYRGYPIEQLAEKSTFIEVSYLLIYGELPTAEQLRDVHQPDSAAHPAARGPQAVLRRLPAQRAPDAGAVQRGQCAERVLPGLAGSARSTTRSSCRPSGCWPSCRPSRPTPTRSRWASRSCTRTTR